jgi:O-acetyl-ADP-ribose deacetylase (regulator of RNase III)/uncharacterized protein YwgA
MFKALIGDLFESPAAAWVNTVNCVGVMGKGVAQEFKQRFPAMFDDYRARCDAKQVKLGEPYLYRDASGRVIINFPTKGHWRSPSRLADIERGLDYFAAHALDWGLTSVAMPPLGCGNGGLAWADVAPLIWRKLHALPIDVELYAPYGTPKSELGIDFLSAASQMSIDDKGRQADKLNPDWVVLMEVVRELGQQPYANPVGRVVFQKIAYVLTEMGVPTGFRFGKGSYGPFSDDVGRALHVFANRNWVHEEPLGRMIALRVSEQYERDRGAQRETIERHARKVHKAVDLFSRIKSTEQAEEVLTVLFASRELKAARPHEDVTEQELFDYILEWKQSWRSEDKRLALASAIRNLVLLGWMKVQVSEQLLEAA